MDELRVLTARSRRDPGEISRRSRGDERGAPAPRRQLGAPVPLTLSVSLSLDLERLGGSKPAATAAADALAAVGAAVAEALPGAVTFGSASLTSLDVLANVAAVGDDSNDAAAQASAIRVRVRANPNPSRTLTLTLTLTVP